MPWHEPTEIDESALPSDEEWERWMMEQELRLLNERRAAALTKDQPHD